MKAAYCVLLTALFASAVPVMARAQQAGSSESVPLIRANARDVVIDVVVTKGKDPAKGLKGSDFLVFEDGKLQKIDFFEEHTARNLPQGTLPAPPAMPSGVYTNVPSAPVDEAVDVILLDTLNTETQDQVNMRNHVVQFLETLKPNRRVAIFSLGSKLHYIQGFTSDSSQLLAALHAGKLNSGPEQNPNYRTRGDKADDKEAIAILKSMSMGYSTAGIDAMSAALEDIGHMENADRTTVTLEALQFLARYLANVPGRKNLIWFASSFPVNVFPTAGQLQDISDRRLDLSEIKAAADLLTVARVAVYPIGAEGLMQDYSMAADSNLDAAGRGSALATNLSGESNEHANNIFNMEQLAQSTGGRAFYNTNDLSSALESAFENGANYYTLVYSPTNKKMNGQFRKIAVKVNGGGYKLSYRQGYNAEETPQGVPAKTPGPLLQMMALGLPSATQVLYGLRVTPAAQQPTQGSPFAGKNKSLTGPLTRYDVDFLVRWSDVKLVENADGKHGGLLMFEMFAYDVDGHAVNWTGGTQQMALTPDYYQAIQRSGIPGHFEIDLPADKQIFLETGVYDPSTEKAGTLQISFDAKGAAAHATAQLHPADPAAPNISAPGKP